MKPLSIAQSLTKEKLASIKAEMKRLAAERTEHHQATKRLTAKIEELNREWQRITDEQGY